jgi:hypothetical protein
MEQIRPAPEAERVQRLEREVERLTSRLGKLERRAGLDGGAREATAAPTHGEALRWALYGEQWTGRVGLGVFFLGLVFLFQFSIEQGWLTPLVRVLFGVVLGAGFLLLGLRAAPRRPSYGAILLAGAIATFYATGWAASYLFELIGRPMALVWMSGVTLLALSLSWRQWQPSLASLGAMGGFATPFLLSADGVGVPELVIHASLVVLWTSVLFFARGWRSVLWTYLIGGASVLAVAAGSAEAGERWMVQAAVVLVWLLGAALPFWREASASGAESPAPRALVPFAIQLRLLGAGGSAAALALTDAVWNLPDRTVGGLFLLVALGYAAFAWLGTREPNFVARSAAPVAAALAATATFLLFPEGPLRWYAVAAQVGAYLYVGVGARFRGIEWVGHGLFAMAALNLLLRGMNGESVAFDPTSFAILATFIAGATASRWVATERGRAAYQFGCHLLLLIWLALEFGAIGTTSEWVTVAWGVYGAGMLVSALELGRRRRQHLHTLQLFAGSALTLAVLKLLAIDMAQVSALVRIPLFMGVGAALLALSALFQRSVAPRGAGGEVLATGTDGRGGAGGD